jgi:tetratricopeptide (TPR) repeat protein
MGKASRRRVERAATVATPAAAARPSPRSAPRARATEWGWLLALAAPACIVALGAVLYANSFQIPFLFDDHFEIVGNKDLQTVDSPLGYLRRSRGLVTLTLALNSRSSGSDVWGFHLVNVTVHLVNALLVYTLVLFTLRLPGQRERYGADARVLAGVVALVFVAHPLQTMAASYIVQRAESMAAGFYLLTLLLYALAATATIRAWRILGLATALLAAALGTACKEIVVTVPLAAAVYHFCFLRREGGSWRAGRLIWIALLFLPLAYGVWLSRYYLLPIAEEDPTAPRSWIFMPTAGFSVEGLTAWRYLLTQFGVILWYLRLYVLPTRLCFDYGWPLVDAPWRADVLVPLVVLLGFAAVAIACYRRYRLATFCIAWVFITLAPSSSVIPLRDAAFEHRMYLPVIGLSWLVVAGGYDLLHWAAARWRWNWATVRQAALTAAAMWIVLLGAGTMSRNQVLADPMRLAADNAAKAPGNWRAQFAYGSALSDAQRFDESIAALQEAVRLAPEQGAPRVQLGQLLLRAGRRDAAEQVLAPATAVLEESVAAAAYQQLAMIYEGRGDPLAAAAALREAERRKPAWWSVHRQLAAIYTRIGFWYGAAGHYNEALELNPRLRSTIGDAAIDANIRAAALELAQGNTDSAGRLVEFALQYDPAQPTARHQRAVLRASAGEWGQAEAELADLEKNNPADTAVMDNLARARARQPLIPPAVLAPPGG